MDLVGEIKLAQAPQRSRFNLLCIQQIFSVKLKTQWQEIVFFLLFSLHHSVATVNLLGDRLKR